MKRTDIPHSDVFFSWTGADRDMKDQIVAYLRQRNMKCTESDSDCCGDFTQWSREAVSKSTIFLLLYTENTPKSEWVPEEIKAFQKEDDYKNRCVPVVTNFDVYKENVPDLAKCESVVDLGKDGLTEKQLDKIYYNVRELICNRLFAIYRQATTPTYLRFVSLLQKMRLTEEGDHQQLYINRSVTDESGQDISDAAAFCKTQDIIYLYGPAGSGKTCYIDQLRNAADVNTLVLSLPCRTLSHTDNLFDEMYTEFCRYCGNRDYYSKENFKSLLSVKHLLLVLDGLDEIGTQEGKDTLFHAAKDYYLANANTTTLFITSRSNADADSWKMNGQTPKVLKLHALEEEQIKDFGDNLFLLFGAPDKGNEFYADIRNIAEEIRTNPLLLSQLAIIYKEKSQIPQTIVGIYDEICDIIVGKAKPSSTVAADFDEKIFPKLSSILKNFSAERYRLQSQGKEKSTEQIFKKILRDHGFAPDDAPALILYLEDRAIWVGNEFYHKMLLEYFTAVYYYEQCFDDYDELENPDGLRSLFDHYNDPYWSAVLQMFLIKADSRADAENTDALYGELLKLGITDFTLLFDTCQKLLFHKEPVQKILLTDILECSATKVYPPYGPLFWYVPEYDLYGTLLSVLDTLQDKPCFTNALALTRDVCWIFGKYHTAEAVNNRVDGKKLLAKASLTGIRKGLCELFYEGSTDCANGNNIYPRCFNLAEARRWKEEGLGIYGRMDTAFEDELGLYSHEMLQPFGEKWVGIVSMEYDIPRIEETLSSLSCSKLCGLFLSPSWYLKMLKLSINDKHLSVIYVPENVRFQPEARAVRPFAYPGIFVHDDGLMYFDDKVILPDGITEIGAHAFAGCSSLTSVTIPEGVMLIDSHAFDGCSSLTSVTLPESVAEIDIYAFRGCHSLTSITIPDSVTKVGWSAFEDCSSLATITIPKSVTEIEQSVFSGCRSLISIKIPEGITKIETNAFAGCSALTSVTIPESVTWIEDAVFEGCCSLTSITLPENVPGIGKATFRNCSALTSIIIPSGVTGIEEEAFEGCSSLTSIIIPDGVEGIERDTFRNCSALTSITLPDGVYYIGESSFAGCSSLTSIKMPEQLRFIDHGVFAGCAALTHITNCPTFFDRAKLGVSDDCVIDCREIKQMNVVFHSETEILPEEFYSREDITSIVLPEGVTKIGVCAFRDCRSLSSITIPESVTEIGGEAFDGCSSLTSVTIPAGVTKIEFGTFSGCNSLTSIAIPQGVTEIEAGAFGGCNSLTSIIIPDKVTAIGASAFAGCSSLTSITLPDHVTKIEGYAFEGCSSIVSIVIPKGVVEIGWCTFEGCSSLISVTIPEGVAEIGLSAFEGCSSLTSVTIPAGVTKIEFGSFRGCSSLTSITLPKGVAEIGSHAFEGCRSLASISIPDSVTEIGSGAFYGCSSLTSITLPKGVAEIGSHAFKDCSSLTSITLPDGVAKIGWNVFKDCSSLTSITLPDSVSDIGCRAFSECHSLTSFTIPKNVTTIDAHAFSGCSSLVSISIPKNVRTIGNNAFAGCTGLREITLSRRFEDDLPRIFPDVDLSKVKITWH